MINILSELKYPLLIVYVVFNASPSRPLIMKYDLLAGDWTRMHAESYQQL